MNVCCFMGFIKSDLRIKNDGTDGQKKRSVEFTLAIPRFGLRNCYDLIPITAFSNLANTLEKYFTKEDKIAVVCTVNTRKYKNEAGENVYQTGFIAQKIFFPDKKEVAPGKYVKGIKVADEVEIFDDNALIPATFYVPDEDD